MANVILTSKRNCMASRVCDHPPGLVTGEAASQIQFSALGLSLQEGHLGARVRSEKWH